MRPHSSPPLASSFTVRVLQLKPSQPGPVTTTAPVDAETSQQHNHVWYCNPARDPKIDRIGQAFVKEVNRQFTDDIPIWENKIYVDKPNLCDGDGPIARFRKWAQQFYVGAA